MQATTIEYTRPVPRPFRSERRSRLSGPVTFQSEAFSGSLLVTLLISHAGAGSLSSITVTSMVTDVIRPLDGHRTSGVALMATTVGGTTAGKIGQGDGPGPAYEMHQFLSNVLRAPFIVASSLMSKPIGPYVLETWAGGFPATMFPWIVLPDAGA